MPTTEPSDAAPDSLRAFFSEEEIETSIAKMAEVMQESEVSAEPGADPPVAGEPGEAETAAKLRSTRWPGVAAKIVENAAVLFDSPISAILARAYADSPAVKKLANKDAHDPQEPAYVELSEHTIDTRQLPRFDIVVNGKSIGSMGFEIEISMEINGVKMKVENARIKEITPGRCVFGAKILFMKQVILDKQSSAIRFGKAMSLGEGVPIGTSR